MYEYVSSLEPGVWTLGFRFSLERRINTSYYEYAYYVGN